MAASFEDPDELIPCPYDPVHMVARKRMPYHIMKCRKNFGQRDFATCPFNARHIVPKREFDDHLRHCKDRHLAEVDIMKEQEDLKREREGTILKGNTSVPTSNFVPESSESWDDENYVVEIKPREGLFATMSNEHRGRGEERPQVPRTRVGNPPDPRLPRGTHGTGSEVYNYSVQRRQEERRLPQQQTQPQPQIASLGRGRGRGRGRGASPGQVGQNLSPGRPVGRGAGALRQQEQQQQRPPRPSPGFVPLQPQGQSPAAVPIGPHLGEEDLTKRERKLKKMLRQIETLEEKQGRGEPLDADQEAKILRKNDVLVQLEQVESQRKAEQ